MKTKYIIIICAIAIFCCLIVATISTINSDYDDLNEINLTDEYDSETGTYTFTPYIEISLPASYSINDDILTIESGHIIYQEFKIIDDDNNLILNIPETINAEIVYYNYSYDDKDYRFNRYIFYDNGYVLIEAGEEYDDNEQSDDYPWDRYSSIAYTKYEEVEEDLYLVYLTGMFYKVFRYYDINGEITEYMDSVYSEFGW